MFNNKGLFPAYSGLGDIEVSLPSPPSRAQVARSAEDLWQVHTSEPHVTAPSDPGIAVPYPDNGFEMGRDFSEDSAANELANRAGQPLTDSARGELLERLSDEYTSQLVANLQMSSMSPGEIKESMQKDCVGSLLVYNGNDRDSLIKAYTLIKSLDAVVDQFVRNSTFTEDAKAEMITFISPCAAVRDAMLLPDHVIRQRLFGSTESRDSLEHALQIFDLGDDSAAVSRVNPVDSEFADFLEKIDFAELELDRAIQQDMVDGDSHKAMYNALNQVLPAVGSQEVRDKLTSVVMAVRRGAEEKAKRTSKSLSLLMSKLRKDLESIGVDAHSVEKLVQKEEMHRAEAASKVTTPTDLASVAGHKTASTTRPARELRRIYSSVDQLAQGLGHSAANQRSAPRAALCCKVELYTILCIRDCCAAMIAGQDALQQCVENLRSAVEAELKESLVPQITPLRSGFEKAHKDLQSARKSKTMESLNRAKSESLISDKKLETLKQIIG
jgi:hypothetical protein